MRLNTCPNCHQGKIFGSLFRMNSECDECGFRFDREYGYFLGAMVASYFALGFTLVVWLLLSFWVWNLSIELILGVGGFWILVSTPLFYRLSRQIWIQVEHAISRTLK